MDVTVGVCVAVRVSVGVGLGGMTVAQDLRTKNDKRRIPKTRAAKIRYSNLAKAGGKGSNGFFNSAVECTGSPLYSRSASNLLRLVTGSEVVKSR